jgi:ribosomal protein S18 acetylase RimI-like enzyme
MSSTITIEAARAHELPAAFGLMYQHLDAREHEDCVVRSLQLVDQGELQVGDVLVIRGSAGLRGTMVCCTGIGACGQIWPPQVAAGEEPFALEDALVRHGLAVLRGQGARFVQCLVAPEDAALAPALTRNGFSNPTALLLMRHQLRAGSDQIFCPLANPALTYRIYDEDSAELFAQTLLRTYEGTLDFPELNGMRTSDEILAGHRTHGTFDPAKWFVVLKEGTAAGLLLLADDPEFGECELAYLGVVPAVRGQGIGRALVRKAVQEAWDRSAAQLIVSVDRRNHVARNLYEREGFEQFDVRDVYLMLWQDRTF